MTEQTTPPDGAVSFTAMEDGTAEDYAFLDRLEREHARGLGDRVLAGLERLSDSLGGYRVSRLDHSLQTATRARMDGADVDWVVAALVHDLGDELAPYNHAEYAAAVLRPYVREEVTWVVEQHGVFQSWYFAHLLGGDRNGRDQFAGHPWADLCAGFCARWDQSSFDPDHRTDPLDSFADEVHEVFGRPAHDATVTAAGAPRLFT
ncbi:HD domain-containing protein [Ilumatobacter sp.]|uniref:HD domain-containing protein n=1 Tax=Ilumatobacter sp. TaxID=1967498 RepID=UPI003C5F255F